MVDLDLSDLPFILEKSHQLLDLVVVLWDILDKYAIFSFSLGTRLLLVHLVAALRIVHGHFGICVIDGRWGRWCEVHFALGTWRWWRRDEVLSSEEERCCEDRL